MTENESLKKKIKKVVEEIIVLNENEFEEKFSEEEIKDAIKHKTKISKLSVEDEQLIKLIKDEVEDIVGMYLLQKSFKKKNKRPLE